MAMFKIKNGPTPNKHGKKWSKEEDNQLLQDLKSDISLDDISKKNERTLSSIKLRMEKHAVDMYKDKVDIKQIEKLTRLKNIEKLASKYEMKEGEKKKGEKKKVEKKKVLIQPDLRKILEEIKNLQIELVDKFKEFRKFDKLGLFDEIEKEKNDDVEEKKEEKKEMITEKKIKIDISVISVDGCCNDETKISGCGWGSVVDKNSEDLIPKYKHLSKDFKYEEKRGKNKDREVIIAQATDVKEQQNNYAELLSFLFALRIATNNENVKEICSDANLIIKFWGNPTHNTKLTADENKNKYIQECKKLRKNFETRGGIITKVDGGENLADLGYHIN
jgi:ribonuclease HI